jgi:hypothetical protein
LFRRNCQTKQDYENFNIFSSIERPLRWFLSFIGPVRPVSDVGIADPDAARRGKPCQNSRCSTADGSKPEPRRQPGTMNQRVVACDSFK